jgi:alkylation response protein AidB-like acyl-CoA dehydrogenase
MATTSNPLSAARSLRATIQSARQETEANRRLAPQVVEGLIETGLCRLAVPASLGGHEAEPVVALKVYEELAAAEASVAWIAWNNSLPALLSRGLSDAIRTELFRDARRIFANSTRPSGKAVVVNNGFRVSGRWSLVSGCELADWIPLTCVIIEGDAPRMRASGVPDIRMAYIPKGSYTILDTWYVGGLRGTGSHDVVVEDVFVPAERTYSFTDPNRIARPLYDMPFAATMSAGCAAICLGVAQTAINSLLELSTSKAQIDPGPSLRERPMVQAMVAAATAELEAARLLLHHATEDTWAACRQGIPVTEAQRARLWGGSLHAAKTAKAVVTSMYEAAGTSALYVDCPLERAQRDIYAIAPHVILAPRWLEDAGRVWLGLKPSNPLF